MSSISGPVPSREAYRGISLYGPRREPCAIDLSDNTNLWGAPPSAAAAIRSAMPSAITRYPSVYGSDFKQAVGRYLGVPPECVVTGCGSDGVLDSAIRAFAEPGDRVVYPEPSFVMVPLFTRMNGLNPAPIPLAADFDIDAERMSSARGRITYICSPNNPTGTLASRPAIEHVLDRAEGLVIVDEAYAEFTDDSFAREAVTRENLLVVRTLSKAFGLAGLRVGYAVGHPAIVAEVEKSRGPYKLNAIAELAAVAALTDDLDWVSARVADVVANRSRLASELTALGAFDVLPSAANFLLAIVRQGRGLRAAGIASGLAQRGIAVRSFTNLPGVGDAIRITVGPWEMMQECHLALGQIVAGSSRA